MSEANTNYPNFPQQAIHYKEIVRVNKGRFVTVDFNVNTDGKILGSFKMENMQALAGCHLAGHIEVYDTNENLVGRVKLPRLGLKPAWLGKSVVRAGSFEGELKADHLNIVKRVAFFAYEDANNTISRDIEEVRRALENWGII